MTGQTDRTVTIRLAEKSDAGPIAKVGRETFAQTFAHSCPASDLEDHLESNYTLSTIDQEISSPSRRYIVAVGHDGKLAGFASLALDSDDPCVSNLERRVELQRIYVDATHHGQGVANALLQAILDLARRAEYRHIWLGVWEDNDRANRFYSKWGFVKVGEHVFSVGSDDQTDWILMREL
jgi:ribosomal protein S18 acetylase RimI-like enzyme